MKVEVSSVVLPEAARTEEGSAVVNTAWMVMLEVAMAPVGRSRYSRYQEHKRRTPSRDRHRRSRHQRCRCMSPHTCREGRAASLEAVVRAATATMAAVAAMT